MVTEMSEPQSDITIRLASEVDATGLRTLAELDSRPVPAGRVLVAEVDGRLRAAVALDGGEAIADPFRRTADLVALLAAARRPPGGTRGGRSHYPLGA